MNTATIITVGVLVGVTVISLVALGIYKWMTYSSNKPHGIVLATQAEQPVVGNRTFIDSKLLQPGEIALHIIEPPGQPVIYKEGDKVLISGAFGGDKGLWGRNRRATVASTPAGQVAEFWKDKQEYAFPVNSTWARDKWGVRYSKILKTPLTRMKLVNQGARRILSTPKETRELPSDLVAIIGEFAGFPHTATTKYIDALNIKGSGTSKQSKQSKRSRRRRSM